MLCKSIPDEFKQGIPSWMGFTSTTAAYEHFVQIRVNNTCEWILQQPKFHEWARPAIAHTKALWIHGPAGYGKTVLCAKIIQHLRTLDSTIVAHHFLSSGSDGRADLSAILRDWTYHLMRRSRQAFKHVYDRWVASAGRPLSDEGIQELFATAAKLVPGCIFIIDGLDETVGVRDDWREKYRQSILQLFRLLRQCIPRASRVLITSRDHTEIREGFFYTNRPGKEAWVLREHSMEPEDVREDAMRFARSIVDSRLCCKDEDQRFELSSRLVDRFGCMFLGIRSVEGQLHTGESLDSLRRMIDRAPTELGEIYCRSLERIIHHPEPHRSRALALLRWATFGMRPMSILEMAAALSLADEGGETSSEEGQPPRVIDEGHIRSHILELCGSLVEIRGPAPEPALLTIHLAHYSVKQHLLCHKLIPGIRLIRPGLFRTWHEVREHNTLGIACLRYLNSDRVWQETLAEGKKAAAIRAFRHYAATSWHQHVRRFGNDTCAAMPEVNNFFHPGNKCWDLWRQQADPSLRATLPLHQEVVLRHRGEISEPGSRLFYVALLGLMETMATLITDAGMSVNHVDSSNRTALLAASSAAWYHGVAYLIQNGADPNIRSNEGVGPLFAACVRGHRGIVELLLENGADWTAADNFGEAPLFAACINGHIEVIQLLLDKGADVTVANHQGWTALNAAARSGSSRAVRLLLENGADPTVADSVGLTPLIAASACGYQRVVELLLSVGVADSASPSGNNAEPLHWACRCGRSGVVKLLLEKGSDPTLANNEGWTPLQVASGCGHLEVVRLLLCKGADLTVAAGEDNGRTPLQLASSCGHLEVVKLLLDKGADPAVMSKDGWRPLTTASSNGYLQVAKLLLDNGASPKAAVSDRWAPLHEASSKGHLDVIKLLLNHGADLGAAINKGRVPLHEASSGGHLDVVKLLVDHGANLNVSDDYGCTPLHMASRNGAIEVVKLLLDNGADLTVHNTFGETPLDAASNGNHGHLNVVKLLLVRWANLTMTNNHNHTWRPRSTVLGSSHMLTIRASMERKGADLAIARHPRLDPQLWNFHCLHKRWINYCTRKELRNK